MSYIREFIIGFKKRGLHIGILWVWLFIEGKIVPYPSDDSQISGFPDWTSVSAINQDMK